MSQDIPTARAAGPAPRAPRKALSGLIQFPIFFIVFLFFAAGDLGSAVDFGSAKYQSYRVTFLTISSSMTGSETQPVDGRSIFGPIIFACLFLSALIRSIRTGNRLSLTVGMAALHALGIAIAHKYLNLFTPGAVNLALSIGVVISLVWIVAYGKIWSGAYALLLVVTYPFVAAILPSGEGLILNRLLPYLTLHASFLVLIMILRTSYLLVRDNVYVFRTLGWGGTFRVGCRTLLRWAPILILAGPYFLVSWQIDRMTKLTAYQ